MRILAAVIGMSCLIAVPSGAAPTIGKTLPTTHAPSPPGGKLARALDFLSELDNQRIGEKAYAKRLLEAIDVVRASSHFEGDKRHAVDLLRVLALWGSGQTKEALADADAMTASGAALPEIYLLAIQLAAATEPLKAVEYLDRADKHLLAPEPRGTFTVDLDDDSVFAIRRALTKAKNNPAHARFAEGLLKFDWPGEAQFAVEDDLRLTALQGRMAQGNVAGARTLARQISNPSTALELLLLREYDALVDSPDRVARFAALVAAEDERSARVLKAKPDDLKLILTRAQFLRSVGREGDALSLLMPHSSDMAAVEKGGADAFWIVNEAAYALRGTGRSDDALALMRRLIALDMTKHPDLISMAINTAEIMNRVGRYRDAAAYAEDLSAKHADKASKYGQMWMWEAAACGHAMGGNADAARPWIAKLRADPELNRAAVMRGLLCINDIDGAAAQFIARLNGDNPGGMLLAAQDFTLVNPNVPESQVLDQRLRQVVARPAVAAAIASKGRILKLPLSRAYWGMY